jgi:hypothetical protein
MSYLVQYKIEILTWRTCLLLNASSYSRVYALTFHFSCLHFNEISFVINYIGFYWPEDLLEQIILYYVLSISLAHIIY